MSSAPISVPRSDAHQPVRPFPVFPPVVWPLLTSRGISSSGSPQIRACCFPARPPHLPPRLNPRLRCVVPLRRIVAGLDMRFLFVSPPVSSTLPPAGRLPFQRWLRVVVLSHFHVRFLLQGTCTPFTTRPCWAYTSDRTLFGARCAGSSRVSRGIGGGKEEQNGQQSTAVLVARLAPLQSRLGLGGVLYWVRVLGAPLLTSEGQVPGCLACRQCRGRYSKDSGRDIPSVPRPSRPNRGDN